MDQLATLVERVAADYNADVFYYAGEISRQGYENLTRCCVTHTPKKNACLFLATYGGDAHAAYRIARALRHHYEKLHVFIPRECKSAGTLLVIGATSLIISDRGELGPLDVQLSKPDEIFERSSGLDIMQSLYVLREEALGTFLHYLLSIKGGSSITVRTAAEIASKLAVGLFSPIYAQIDPLKLGEIRRAIMIAYEYGQRLDKYDQNLKPDTLDRLVTEYPSHSFVIDRQEARQLFQNVRAAHPYEEHLGELLYQQEQPDRDMPFVSNFTTLPQNQANHTEDEHEKIQPTDPKADGSP